MNRMILLVISAMIFMMSVNGYAEDLRIRGSSSPPGNFMNEQGEFVGLSVNVVRKIQKRVGNTDKVEMIPWNRIYKTALKESNLVFFNATRTPEPEDKFHWVTLMMRKPWAFYAKKNSNLQIKSLEDTKKLSAIGVQEGDIRDT